MTKWHQKPLDNVKQWQDSGFPLGLPPSTYLSVLLLIVSPLHVLHAAALFSTPDPWIYVRCWWGRFLLIGLVLRTEIDQVFSRCVRS